ncbi:hypothetical protein ACNRWW_14255 [Metabacillus sp. HB246100]
MSIEAEKQYFLRKDHASDIVNDSYIKFLRDKSIQFVAVRHDIIRSFQLAVNEGKISNEELKKFLDKETRFGHNRTVMCKDLDIYSLKRLKSMTENEIVELMKKKGWNRPKQNNILSIYLPETLTLAEVSIIETEEINLTFIETIKTLKKNIIDRENNYYFITVDLLQGTLYIRMRPRGNNVTLTDGDDYKKVTDTQCFYKILKTCTDMLDITLIDSTHFKSTLYLIAKELTEKAEEQWRNEVQKYNENIQEFSQEIESKLNGLDKNSFDLEFRLHRLLERALIQSNFEQIKQKEPGKKGFINAFHFSDKSGGKIKASSREKERAIDLSEIYYDTRDTIDKRKAYDTVWVNWFVPGKKVSLSTRLEANNEFYQVHFYNYLNEDDYYYVLSEINYFKQKQVNE